MVLLTRACAVLRPEGVYLVVTDPKGLVAAVANVLACAQLKELEKLEDLKSFEGLGRVGEASGFCKYDKRGILAKLLGWIVPNLRQAEDKEDGAVKLAVEALGLAVHYKERDEEAAKANDKADEEHEEDYQAHHRLIGYLNHL